MISSQKIQNETSRILPFLCFIILSAPRMNEGIFLLLVSYNSIFMFSYLIYLLHLSNILNDDRNWVLFCKIWLFEDDIPEWASFKLSHFFTKFTHIGWDQNLVFIFSIFIPSSSLSNSLNDKRNGFLVRRLCPFYDNLMNEPFNFILGFVLVLLYYSNIISYLCLLEFFNFS